MGMRYFELHAPRADFTGRIGPISFADGVARVQFDDTRTGGRVVADEHGVSPGRSAVMFARRRRGYRVVELDAAGRPLTDQADDSENDDGDGPRRPAGNASRDAWATYAAGLGIPAEAIDAAKARADVIALVDEHDKELSR